MSSWDFPLTIFGLHLTTGKWNLGVQNVDKGDYCTHSTRKLILHVHTLWEFGIRCSMELLASWRTLVEELVLYFFPFNLLTKSSFVEGLAMRGFCLARISLFQFCTYKIINVSVKQDIEKTPELFLNPTHLRLLHLLAVPFSPAFNWISGGSVQSHAVEARSRGATAALPRCVWAPSVMVTA